MQSGGRFLRIELPIKTSFILGSSAHTEHNAVPTYGVVGCPAAKVVLGAASFIVALGALSGIRQGKYTVDAGAG